MRLPDHGLRLILTLGCVCHALSQNGCDETGSITPLSDFPFEYQGQLISLTSSCPGHERSINSSEQDVRIQLGMREGSIALDMLFDVDPLSFRGQLCFDEVRATHLCLSLRDRVVQAVLSRAQRLVDSANTQLTCELWRSSPHTATQGAESSQDFFTADTQDQLDLCCEEDLEHTSLVKLIISEEGELNGHFTLRQLRKIVLPRQSQVSTLSSAEEAGALSLCGGSLDCFGHFSFYATPTQ